jgi:hypothetical protein
MVKDYAKKIGADLNLISERKFPDFPVYYEAMQIFESGEKYEWNLYLRPGGLLGEQLPDVTGYCSRDAIATCILYPASGQFLTEDNIYFQRDARNLGISDTVVLSSRLTHEIWEPLPSPYSTYKNTVLDGDTTKISSFALSYNIAKYQLKVSGIFLRDAQYDYITEGKLRQMPIEEYVARMVRFWRNRST